MYFGRGTCRWFKPIRFPNPPVGSATARLERRRGLVASRDCHSWTPGRSSRLLQVPWLVLSHFDLPTAVQIRAIQLQSPDSCASASPPPPASCTYAVGLGDTQSNEDSTCQRNAGPRGRDKPDVSVLFRRFRYCRKGRASTKPAADCSMGLEKYIIVPPVAFVIRRRAKSLCNKDYVSFPWIHFSTRWHYCAAGGRWERARTHPSHPRCLIAHMGQRLPLSTVRSEIFLFFFIFFTGPRGSAGPISQNL